MKRERGDEVAMSALVGFLAGAGFVVVAQILQHLMEIGK